MLKTIQFHKKSIDYTLKVSKKAKRMRLAVYCDGSCVITAPHTLPQTFVEQFLIRKSQWILDKIFYFKSAKINIWEVGNKEDYLKYKDQALHIVEKRITYFNTFYGYNWNSIVIKNQKTRWGSCSKKAI